MECKINMEKLKREFYSISPLKCPETHDSSIRYVMRLCRKRNNFNLSCKKLFTLIDGTLDKIQEQLNLGNWKDVPIYDRQIITFLSFYKLLLCINMNNIFTEDTILKLFNIIDRGLLFGAPLTSPHSNLLHECESIIGSNDKSKNNRFSSISKRININCENYRNQILIENYPTLETFYSNFMHPKIPVVLKNCINDWNALQLWDFPDYLIQKAGHRIVPIELGSKYTDSDWTQKLILFSHFIKQYILSDSKTIGYLAQHQLFDQIPELLEDFKIPDYCGLHEDNIEYISNVEKNAWFGPAGTISPLHTDPKHNLLSQVVGEKLIILFSPNDNEYLYCHDNNLLQNTSQVDPVNPDFGKHQDFVKATSYYHILKAGEMLYIPPKWWHYVKSLSISFSVSFWWN